MEPIQSLNTIRAEIKALEKQRKQRTTVDEEKLRQLKARQDVLKENLITGLRAALPDEFLPWLDACYVITEQAEPTPLFGTGGNEGSMDFSINHLILLTELIDPDSDRPSAHASVALDESLFSIAASLPKDANPGFLAPSAVGGFNMTSGFEGGSMGNPWDVVLMVEGLVLLAAAAVRRFDLSAPRSLSAPFFVEAAQAGRGAIAVSERSRPEFWAPLWSTPFSMPEVRALFTEGRATLGARRAQTGLDMARAISSLGVDRGLRAFQRFGFYERRGQGYFVAAPLERFQISRNPGADLLDDLDRFSWLRTVQRYTRNERCPNVFRSAARRLESALITITQRPDRDAFQRAMREIGDTESLLSLLAAKRAGSQEEVKAQELVPDPVPPLSPQWAKAADDGSAEFHIATALAGLCWRDAGGAPILQTRRHLVAVSEARDWDGRRQWEPDSPLVVWGPGPLEKNLSVLLHRRRLVAEEFDKGGEALASTVGATCSDIERFIYGETDDKRINELLRGLVCVDLSQYDLPPSREEIFLPSAFLVLKPFFTAESALRRAGFLPPGRNLRLPAEIPARLAYGDIRGALQIAWRRLRALDVRLPGLSPPQPAPGSGLRLLAALMVPLTPFETRRVLGRLNLASVREQTEPQERPQVNDLVQ
ncbi:MAG TPA: type I-U CRISPR-associated protein Csx17 [Candidatus Acidoferrales bacterium]|nr:type I-U CRISPR-associated protein Csx17 [Candidatus Acidoferrales bacterium]